MAVILPLTPFALLEPTVKTVTLFVLMLMLPPEPAPLPLTDRDELTATLRPAERVKLPPAPLVPCGPMLRLLGLTLMSQPDATVTVPPLPAVDEGEPPVAEISKLPVALPMVKPDDELLFVTDMVPPLPTPLALALSVSAPPETDSVVLDNEI